MPFVKLNRNRLPLGVLLWLVLFTTLLVVARFAAFYWLLGLVHVPGDWRGTAALALTVLSSSPSISATSK